MPSFILLHGDVPPLHPILVNFTAALIPVSLLSDLLGRLLRRESLQATAWWTLLFAAVVTPFTAFAGWWWLDSMGHMDHWQIGIHKWLGTALAVALIPLAAWRGWMYRRGKVPTVPYLLVGGVFLMALVHQGYLGGSMSFGGHMSATPEHHDAPASAPSGTGDHHGHTDHHQSSLRDGSRHGLTADSISPSHSPDLPEIRHRRGACL